MKFCPLFSGSNGNCAFVSYKDTKVLIDCGCNFKKIRESLSLIGEDISCIDAVLITHSHSDHTSSLPVLLKNLKIPVVASKGTLGEIYPKVYEHVKSLYANEANKKFILKDLEVESFNLPHDAGETVGYNIFAGDKSLSLLTDVGHLAKNLYTDVAGRDIVFLEANHDVNTLENCSYPHHLKQRILSDYGHLSNENAGIFAKELVKKGVKRIILGHLSGEANSTELAYLTVNSALAESGIKSGSDMLLSVASRGELGECVTI